VETQQKPPLQQCVGSLCERRGFSDPSTPTSTETNAGGEFCFTEQID